MIFPATRNWISRVYMATSWSFIWGFLWTFNFWSLLRPRRPVKLLNIGYNIPLPKIRIRLIPCARACWPSQTVWFIQTGWLGQPKGMVCFFFSFWCSIFWGFIAQFNLLLPTCQPYWPHGKQTCQPHEKAHRFEHSQLEFQRPCPPPLTRKYWQTKKKILPNWNALKNR